MGGWLVNRAELRARVFLRALVPLLAVVVREQPVMARLFAKVDAGVQIEVDGSPLCAHLAFNGGALAITHVAAASDLRFGFADVAALNTFFGGALALPRVSGALRHPVLLARVARLFATLQMLQPQGAPKDDAACALRVRLLLYLVVRALAELHHGRHPGMRALTEHSPDRVYQWSVAKEGIHAWLRMKDGRVMTGIGPCLAREPFVHFVFPTAAAALGVLTATGSQVDGVRDGAVEVIGSPEYSRKISLLMQQVDQLLVEG
jgi:hypothetical protein